MPLRVWTHLLDRFADFRVHAQLEHLYGRWTFRSIDAWDELRHTFDITQTGSPLDCMTLASSMTAATASGLDWSLSWNAWILGSANGSRGTSEASAGMERWNERTPAVRLAGPARAAMRMADRETENML